MSGSWFHLKNTLGRIASIIVLLLLLLWGGSTNAAQPLQTAPRQQQQQQQQKKKKTTSSSSSSSSLSLVPPPPRPHILLVVVDDWGYSNVGFHRGSPATDPGAHEWQTPNIDSLAASGIRLERHYVHAFCSPTRSALQTGRLPIHVQLTLANPCNHANGIPKVSTYCVSFSRVVVVAILHTCSERGRTLRSTLAPVTFFWFCLCLWFV